VRAAVAWAPQDAHVFDATLRENLRLGRPDVPDARLADLLERLGLGGLLERLPGGLDGWVGEHGARLSGGERARVSIARALLKPSRLVVLDEPTAHLDDALEAALVRVALEDLHGRALLLVTHRPATAAAASRVLRLRDGRLEPAGSVTHLTHTEDPSPGVGGGRHG
jgi:ABC-type transport system involved in cytochrome bd biosynthesis fused ATPase/permease subunit